MISLAIMYTSTVLIPIIGGLIEENNTFNLTLDAVNYIMCIVDHTLVGLNICTMFLFNSYEYIWRRF
jgi:hypothetical protein